jgi:hypothetical protein
LEKAFNPGLADPRCLSFSRAVPGSVLVKRISQEGFLEGKIVFEIS